MTCCSEANCRRREPIDIVLGDLSQCVVYAVMSKKMIRDHGNGRATFAMGNRHDITDRMRAFIQNNPEWVRGVLSEPF